MSAAAETAPATPSRRARAFGFLQRIGKALMVPVAILPAAGLLLGIGVALQQPALTDLAPWLLNDFWITVSTVMKEAGEIVFDNLPLIFAIGVATGLANDAGVAALAATVGYLIFNVSIMSFLGLTADDVVASTEYTNVLGIPSLQTGVFGGMAVGILAAWVHRRFATLELTPALGFFAGRRSVPIITSALSVLLGAAFIVVWPPLQDGINTLATEVVLANPVPGAFVFGLVERSLIPFGLHHVWYPIFWFEFGEYTSAAGDLVRGDQTIWFRELRDGPAQTNGLYPDFQAGTFMTGKYPFMMFGLPAAALAMYHSAKTHRRKVVAGLFFSAALTSFLTGITEPLEFTFLFVAPLLFAVHAVLAGLSFMIMEILNVHIGLTFSGGLIDFVLFGVLPGRQPWWLVVLVGLAFAVVYYVVFLFGIRLLDAKTPGRGDGAAAPGGGHDTSGPAGAAPDRPQGAQAPLATASPDGSAATTGPGFVRALGGADNIESLDACITRLRVQVADVARVDADALTGMGAAGVVEVGRNVQVIVGPRAESIKDDMEQAMASPGQPTDETSRPEPSPPAGEADAAVDGGGDSEAARLVRAFGGPVNILSLDACITRLRVRVADASRVDTAAIERIGAAGVVTVGTNVQAVFGPRADAVRSAMQELL